MSRRLGGWFDLVDDWTDMLDLPSGTQLSVSVTATLPDGQTVAVEVPKMVAGQCLVSRREIDEPIYSGPGAPVCVLQAPEVQLRFVVEGAPLTDGSADGRFMTVTRGQLDAGQ